MAIYFYSKNDTYNWLSNFSPHGFEFQGEWWPTVEHFFQAQKFHDAAYRERIRCAHTPGDAKTLGRSRSFPLRSDWEEVKEELMFQACLQKFETHHELRAQLLATGEEELVENSPTDYYWGCGRTGTGKNRLGHILGLVREHLRAKAT